MGIKHECKDYMQNGQCVICLGERMAAQPAAPASPPPSPSGTNQFGGRMSDRPVVGRIQTLPGNSQANQRVNPRQLDETVEIMNKYEESAWSGTQFTTASDKKMFNPRVPINKSPKK